MEDFKDRIGLVVANNRFGGQEKRYFKLAYHLYKEGYDVRLYAHHQLRKEKNQEVGRLLNDPHFLSKITFIRAPRILKKLLKEVAKKDLFLSRLNIFVKRDKVDFLITNKDLAALKVITCKKVVKIRDFTSPDDIDFFFKNKEYKYLKNVDHFFFISPSVQHRFESKYNQLSTSVDTPSISTFNLPFYIPPEDHTTISEKEKVIVFAHRFIQRKNPLLFAEAVKLLYRQHELTDWKVLIFGRGPLNDELNLLLKDEIQKGHVEIGYTPRLNEVLQVSSIFVSLIEPDNFPSQSILEAMNYQNALVLLNTGNSSLFINKNGYLVNKNPEEIAEKIIRLTHQNLKEYGTNSKEILQNRFCSIQYISFYTEELKKIR